MLYSVCSSHVFVHIFRVQKKNSEKGNIYSADRSNAATLEFVSADLSKYLQWWVVSFPHPDL